MDGEGINNILYCFENSNVTDYRKIISGKSLESFVKEVFQLHSKKRNNNFAHYIMCISISKKLESLIEIGKNIVRDHV